MQETQNSKVPPHISFVVKTKYKNPKISSVQEDVKKWKNSYTADEIQIHTDSEINLTKPSQVENGCV